MLLRVRRGLRGLSSIAGGRRTRLCGQVACDDDGETIRLKGWVQGVRRMGETMFVGLRDWSGVVQLVMDQEKMDNVELFKAENVVEVEGVVMRRTESNVNRGMRTGAVEVHVDAFRLLNEAKHPLPLDVEKWYRKNNKGVQLANQSARLKARYLDIRGVEIQRNLRVRSAAVLAGRRYLIERADFVEVETPVLFKSTPEGAREFLVPTRGQPGACYALVQSPQQYKQLLMVGGVDRYFQFAKCFRDESGRSDRQPEFTQLDIEMSFVASGEEVQEVTESVVREMWKAGFRACEEVTKSVSVPEDDDTEKRSEWLRENMPSLLLNGFSVFEALEGGGKIPVMRYEEAMERFGSDKPDTRFGLEISSFVEPILVGTGEPHIKARALVIPADMWNSPSRKEMEKLASTFQDDLGTCIAIVRTKETDGSWDKLVLNRGASKSMKELAVGLTEEQKHAITTQSKPNDTIIIALNDRPYQSRDLVCTVLGNLRLHFLREERQKCKELNLLWVVDFPLFEIDHEGDGTQRLKSVHHPFTMPHPDDVEAVLDHESTVDRLLKVRGQHYDFVCNGVELGGGSVRVHRADLQRHIFENILGIPESLVEAYFGHLLTALQAGAPPHAGIAIGMDRLVSMMCETESLVDVMAFPKSATGNELMTNSPTVVSDNALAEYHLKILNKI